MTNSIIITIYRIVAMLIIIAPIILNVFLKSEFITSILYVPLFSLVLALVAIVIDVKLEKTLQYLVKKEIGDIKQYHWFNHLALKHFIKQCHSC